MTVWFGKLMALVTRLAHTPEARHDAALFAGCLVATGVFGVIAGGAPISVDVLTAAVIAAGRRFLVQRMAGR